MDGYIYRALTSGGKRLRPLLVCLAAGEAADEDLVVRLMTSIELMHGASLVHDDIVDRSPLRRSRATINAEKGDGYAALCGFRMIGAALELLRDVDDPEILRVIADIPLEMSRGELRQIEVEFDPDLQTEADYYGRIERKTAKLIEGSLLVGARAAGAPDSVRDALSSYGRALGILFQLRDDLLDYEKATEDGKPIFQDIERGLYSLPLLHAYANTAPGSAKRQRLQSLLKKHIKSEKELRLLAEAAHSEGGVAATKIAIERYAEEATTALSVLHQNAYTEALTIIADAFSGFEIKKGMKNDRSRNIAIAP
jgi:heptaprenyl diphosphate synthase